jgi:hypothetical protein
MVEKTVKSGETRFTVIRGPAKNVPQLLRNLLRDTSVPVLIYLSERYGLHRVPGLPRAALIDRLLRELPAEALEGLQDDLIAARYGSRAIAELLQIALDTGDHAGQESRLGAPRLDDMPPEDATLVESRPGRWVYTMHGHDVIVDTHRRYLACDCHYFRFSSRRQALCKHLARALTLVPEAYARETLIDLLVVREYGGPQTPSWSFRSLKAA